MPTTEGTKVRALREARRLFQSVGINGFSFQHIADSLGIKKPSLYDHFKSKDDLTQALIEDDYRLLVEWMQTIEVFEPKDKIGALFETFYRFSSNDRICPLSALSADYNVLPKRLRKPLLKLFQLRSDWLKDVIQEGLKKKAFKTDLSSTELVELIGSIGLGAQLCARATNDPEKIRSAKLQVFKILGVKN